MTPCDALTEREAEVALLVWEGHTNREIAGVLETSEQVIKNYLRSTFDKLGVWSRLELALYVAAHGGPKWRTQVGINCLSAITEQPAFEKKSCGAATNSTTNGQALPTAGQ
jgi:DNA-binding CsgD family transcriptional regulator